jgi:hypothetical protein
MQPLGELPPPENKTNNFIWELVMLSVCGVLFMATLTVCVAALLDKPQDERLTMIFVSSLSFLTGLLTRRDNG